MKKSLLFLFGLLSIVTANATTYYWVGGATGTLQTSTTTVLSLTSGGSAATVTLTTADDIIFNNTNTGGGATGAATITIGSALAIKALTFTNNASVTFTASSTRAITLENSGNEAFLINAGSSLTCASGSAITFGMGAAAVCTGRIFGSLSLGTSAHKFNVGATGVSSTMAVKSGGAVSVLSGTTGVTLGNVNGAWTFENGSTLTWTSTGTGPFGGGSNAYSVFQPTSTISIGSTTAMAASGRTYGHIIFAANQSPTGASALTCTNITVNTGVTVSIGMTGTGGTAGLNIGGNVSVLGTGSLSISPASAGNVTFNGTSAQTISKAGTLTFGANSNVIIANTASTVSVNSAQTFSGSMTVNAGATLVAGGVTVTLAGTPAINGTFQINQGGWATGGTWSYGSAGKLVFNNTSGPYGVNADVFWPATNGPANVTVQNGGGIQMNVARTVPSSGTNGTFLLVSGTNAVQGTALTLNGTVQINGGNFQTTPTYGSASTLIYNNGSTYTTSNEWTGGATQGVAAGSGIPANVTTQTTNLTLAGGRGVPGNITVGASGQLNLNASSGDLYIGGNLSNSGTWINNSRAVVFVNAGTSTVTASSGTQFFDYLLVNKTSGSVQLATGTNVTINTTAGDVLQMLNAGSLDINGNTLTLNNAGGNILTSGGARSITSTAANGLLDITAAKTVATTGGGTLSFGNNLTVAIAAGVNFGAGLSTINGTLKINTGGSASTNSPTYGSGSTLIYNTGNYNTSNEWIAGGSVGTGVPSNVTLTLAAGTNTVTLGGDRSVPGTLTLTTGEVIIGSNTLTAGTVTATSGSLTGSITSNLTLTGAGSSLRFTSGGTNNYLKNFTIGASGSATLATALNITAWDGVSSEGVLTVTPGGTLATAGFLSIRSNINGTARIAPGSSSGGYITGNVSVERYIPLNASKAWRLLASTTNGQSINTCWQEGAVGGMVNPVPGFGTKITAGASITTNLATAQTAGFDTLSAGVSLYRYNPATDGLVAVTATNGGNNIGSEPGYFLFIRGDRSPGQFGAGAPTTPTVLRQRGTLFQGDQTSSTGAQNYGLVRNPFPSRIDLTAITFGSNVVQAVQLWDPKIGGSYGVGGYQTLTKVGANFQIAPGGGSYGIIGSVVNSVESGAAFFIQSTSNTNNSITIPESAKIASSSNASFRPATPASTDQRVAFSLYANNAGNYDIVDGGLEFFGDTYSNSVTVEDVRKNFNFNENFGIRRDNIDLVVERRLQTNINDTIFFSMSQMRQINYRLDIEATNIDPILNTAILEDKYTNTNTTLDLTAVNAYTFTVDANAASRAADRFRIVFRQSVVVPVTFISVKAAQAGGKIAVEWKVANEVNTLRYEVEKSTDGTRFSKKGTVLAISAGTYNWMDENAVNGYNYYRIKSVDNNGQVKYTQVVKVQVGGKAGITVSPNPVQGNYVNIQINQPLVGKYGIRLTNIAGQAVYNRELMHNGGSASQSFVLPSALSNGVYQLEVVAPDNSKHVEKLIIQGN